MGNKWNQFKLLMWKNLTFQRRKLVQTLFDVLVPLTFTVLLVIYRGQVDPKLQQNRTFPPFCPLSRSNVIPTEALCEQKPLEIMNGGTELQNFKLIYTPNKKPFQDIMKIFHLVVEDVIAVNNSDELIALAEKRSDTKLNVGIEFYAENVEAARLKEIQNFNIYLRFPGELKVLLDTSDTTWATNLKYPQFQFPGPRSPNALVGSTPNYHGEGFLNLQYLITFSIILNKLDFALTKDNMDNLKDWLDAANFPRISMRRFPHSSWYEDEYLDSIKMVMGLVILFSFLHPFITTVKAITAEKENQLKEAMKIMGLPNWIHWIAWFVKTFVMMTISVILLVILLSVKWYPKANIAVLTHSDWSLLLLFLLFYVCATTTLTFAMSAFFSTANSASTVGGLIWIVSYLPYLLTQHNYEDISLLAKLLSSVLSNSAMGLGFHIILLYEVAGEGIRWSNLFSPPTPHDNLSLGIIISMLAFDTLLYLLIALYIEALMPGKYGIAKSWYFPLTKSYWIGEYEQTGSLYDFEEIGQYHKDYFEPEPLNFYQSIQIKNLWKVYGNNIVVKNLYLNILEDQITVLLGHNGAGKSTVLSILTGMVNPTKGSITVDNYDMKTNANNIRQSLGFCPQHNIIFDYLTVHEHLYFFCNLKGLPRAEIQNEIEKYISLLEMETKRDALSSTLSGGLKRKLCVAIALCGKSKVVMLDEPTAGMDPNARRSLWKLIQSEKEGKTILFTTQFMDEADLLGDRIAIMAGGKLQCCGSSFFLKKRYGAGYRLVIDKENDCLVKKVTEELRHYAPDVEMQSSVGSELTYILSETYAYIFEPMLLNLERKADSLGVKSYGISLTTLEDVFMRVGAHCLNKDLEDVPLDRTKEKKVNVNIGLAPNYPEGYKLALNQFLAMFLKRYICIKRLWILLILQMIIPLFFLLIPVLTFTWQENLPSLKVDLSSFEQPIILLEGNGAEDYSSIYKKLLEDNHLTKETTKHLLPRMLDLTKDTPTQVRRKYIVGATFDISLSNSDPDITAWFNNDPYHSPAISLGLALNSIYRMQTRCPKCSINFFNYPQPHTFSTKLKLIDGHTLGYKIAFYAGFSMAFVSSFYVLFIVKEIASKSKHLQFISGLKVYVFWLSTFFCDMVIFIFVLLIFLLALVGLQQDGFSSMDDIGRIFFILMCFGWAALPVVYFVGFFFKSPSSGFTLLTLVSVLTGSAAFAVMESMKRNSTKLEHIHEIWNWVFLWSPHYSLISGINMSYKMFKLFEICDKIYAGCKLSGLHRAQCFEKFKTQYHGIQTCVDYEHPPYFSFEPFGIGKNILISAVEGTTVFIILFAFEYKILSRFTHWFLQIYFPKYPEEVPNEDIDVAKEKKTISSIENTVLREKYMLAVKDLTKYHKKKITVNGLSLGASTHECFGLLGTNGAGKTTTFKMLTADSNISCGDAWLDGYSITKQPKKAQRKIGYCPQFDALLDNMTCRETIIMFSLLRGIVYGESKDIPDYLAKEFDFVRDVDKEVRELSGGNRRKLSAALCLIGDPPLLFLDEPSSGMDPSTKRYLWKALCKIRNSGKCIVLTSHSMEECEALCTRLAIMVNGNFKCLGTPQHLKNKLAEGYSLTIKLRKRNDIIVKDQSTTDHIERFISESLPFAELQEKHEDLLNYGIKDRMIPWPRIFGKMEEAKGMFEDIETYSLSQSSLEQKGTVNGMLLGIENYLKTHRQAGEAVIVNVASVVGVKGYNGLTLAWATHYDYSKVKVISFCPGSTKTPLLDITPEKLISPIYVQLDKDVNELLEGQQEMDVVAENMVNVLKQAENGTIWVSEYSKPAYKIEFPKRRLLSDY